MSQQVRGHREMHRVERIGWLRAAVLGANDGIVSTASLVVGVAAASVDRTAVLVAGFAGLVAGAMSMAVGEFVSVASQRDTEHADLERERLELEQDPEHEHRELVGIYEKRGLDKSLAREVATQMMAHDALGAHARDELGLTDELRARPWQAAVVSAVSFALGAALPLTFAALPLRDDGVSIPAVGLSSCGFLALLGAFGAWAGGAPLLRPTIRVLVGGVLAMAATALVGRVFGAVI